MIQRRKQIGTVFFVLFLTTEFFLHAIPCRAGEPVEDRIIPVYERAVPTVVLLSVAYASRHPLEDPSTTGTGSGFVVDEAGMVVTNAHVVEGATLIMATLHDHDEERMEAELVGLDEQTDVAVLHLKGNRGRLRTVRLGDSDHLRVGQRTLVVGSPLGLGFTLTTGIISRLGPLPLTDRLAGLRLIQTTAPINPGNSGGPLLDSDGRVIGMTTLMVNGAQNIGFAIPINTVKEIVTELKQKGRIARPWLGITGQFLTEEVLNLFALPLAPGLLVADVEDGSPASEAGLQGGLLDVVVNGQRWLLGGDIVTALDSRPIRSPQDFSRATQNLRVGQAVQIEYLRRGEARRVQVILRGRPAHALRRENPRASQGRAIVSPPGHFAGSAHEPARF